LAEGDIDEAVSFIEPLLADPDPTPATEVRNATGGYDVGMLALNGIRPEATTAMLQLLRSATRLAFSGVDRIKNVLRESVGRDDSLSVRAAVGIRLPWLLDDDPDYREAWIETLFGTNTPPESREAAWHAYLLYSRWFRDTATTLAAQYEQALADLTPRAVDDHGRPYDPDEMLGIHVGLAHLFELRIDGVEGWLGRYYGNAAVWARARLTRWMAEQAALADASPSVRDRARSFLRDRLTFLSSDDLDELKVVGWIGPTTDRPQEVLETIVLPALELSRGETEGEPGLADLVARCAESQPRAAARALELLVSGDRWRSLPHIAAEPLRRSLAILRTGDTETRSIVSRTVELLAEEGFLDYRNLHPDHAEGEE
jgi:hypothetical protein